MISIGLMSGTSMDGIEAALLETDGSPTVLRALAHISLTYDPRFKILLKSAEYAVKKCAGNLEQAKIYYPQAIPDYIKEAFSINTNLDIEQKISDLSFYLYQENRSNSQITLDKIIEHSTKLHGIAVKKLLNAQKMSARQVDVVGYHGQTLFHNPERKICIIVGNGQQLADEIGITVVNDFRSRDIEAGGCGAPFAPLYHYALAVRDNKLPIAVVNCGGISNISLILNNNEESVVGFDTGPGNALIDRLVRQRTQGKENMDTDGRYGKQGRVDKDILALLFEKAIIKLDQNYLLQIPPKSLDYNDMTLIPELETLSLEDACATLEVFTAKTLVNSLDLSSVELFPKLWVLAGGGWYNPVILNALKDLLHLKLGTDVEILTADEIGWSSQAMEAQIFAYFAVRSLQNKPLSVPGTTGVPRPTSGGCTYYPYNTLACF
ncbi:MAG TPA: anhydro-N-acetylmuramic acid kinase [Gammaproteobacteria bacterium]|nr:anhydro-N-acetylmuramic acid kinase [Gammaproteobacteria bacterium]HRA42636.1 anhydro-N-acetylmuramic acid kinase [Gammaproteobacteria bacterium]